MADVPKRGKIKLLQIIALVAAFCFLVWLLGVILIEFAPRGPSVARAHAEIRAIQLGIQNFYVQNNQWPMTAEASAAAKPDYTFGSNAEGKPKMPQIVNNRGRGYQAENSMVMFILLSEENAVSNPQHRHNPQKKIFLKPTKFNEGNGKPGVGADRVYRDPWGNPYIISLDVDGDGWVQDAFYSQAAVSKAKATAAANPHSLVSRSGQEANDYAFKGEVMVWSFGPDGQADPTIGADEGVNRDNVLSWAF